MNTTLERQRAPVATASARRPITVIVLIALMTILGVGGMVGGVGLTVDPTGGVFDYPVSWLEGTPFNDFLVPGLLLGLLLGVAPLVVAYGLWRRPLWRWTDAWNGWTGRHWAWTGTVIVGFGLIAWIIVQVIIVPDHSAAATIVQASCGLLGVAIVAVAASKSVRQHFTSEAFSPAGR